MRREIACRVVRGHSWDRVEAKSVILDLDSKIYYLFRTHMGPLPTYWDTSEERVAGS